MIDSLIISGFRGFSRQTNLKFAIPNGNNGSGLTILTGANNSGKTSIIEAIRCFNGQFMNNEGPSFNESQRNFVTQGQVEITIKEKITMPHSTKSVPITTKVNLTTQIIQGDIPNYYNGSFATSSQVFETKIK